MIELTHCYQATTANTSNASHCIKTQDVRSNGTSKASNDKENRREEET
jgi:hypothetical protein